MSTASVTHKQFDFSRLGYWKKRYDALEDFLKNIVIPDDFTSDDAKTLLTNYDDPEYAFCLRFGLGEWFEAEFRRLDFDMCEFLTKLAGELEAEEREAADDYYEEQREYHRVQGGLC